MRDLPFVKSHRLRKAIMKRTGKIVLLSAVLVVLTVALGIHVNTPVNAATATLPFHAVIQGNASPTPIDACTLDNREAGSGTAVHLGAIKWSDHEIAHFLSCLPPNPPGPAIGVTGQFTIEAANGDEIHGEFQTTGTFDPAKGVSVSGLYTLTSGTGRFRNVIGNGVIRANGGASPPFEFVGSLDGTIGYGRDDR